MYIIANHAYKEMKIDQKLPDIYRTYRKHTRKTSPSLNECIRRESWASVQELEKGIMNFVRNWNETGKKCVWVKTAT